MFCDFNKTFHKGQEWENTSLIDKNPCRKCKMYEEIKDLAHRDPILDCKECIGCIRFLAWRNKCIIKLQWYEEHDERLKESKRGQDMISADDARQKLRKNTNKNVANELNKLEKQIIKAVSKEESSISNSGYIQHDTVKELKRLGYKVRCEMDYNEPYYSISWGDNDETH